MRDGKQRQKKAEILRRVVEQDSEIDAKFGVYLQMDQGFWPWLLSRRIILKARAWAARSRRR
jgi:hypothetical protein